MTTLGIVLISYLYPSIRSLQIAVRSRSFMPEKVSSLATPPSNPSKTRDLSIFGSSASRSKATTMNARLAYGDDMEDTDMSELWKKSEIREMRFWIVYFTAFSIIESFFIITRACVGVWPLSSRCRLGVSLYLMSTFFRGGESFLQLIDVMVMRGASGMMIPAQIEAPDSSGIVNDDDEDGNTGEARLLDRECEEEELEQQSEKPEEMKADAHMEEKEETAEVVQGQQDNTNTMDDDNEDTVVSTPVEKDGGGQEAISDDASPGSSRKRTKRSGLRKRK